MTHSAELSSVSTQLHELTGRVTRSASELDKAGQEAEAFDLYEVERLLRTAARRLDRAVRELADSDS